MVAVFRRINSNSHRSKPGHFSDAAANCRMDWSDRDDFCAGECDPFVARAESLGAKQIWRHVHAAWLRSIYLVCLHLQISAYRDKLLAGAESRKSFICITISRRSP